MCAALLAILLYALVVYEECTYVLSILFACLFL